MTTLSPTQARSNLTRWLQRAAQGEDICILYGNRVIALRPVEIEATDYAWREYGTTPEQLKAWAQHLHEEGQTARDSGTLKTYTGDIEALL